MSLRWRIIFLVMAVAATTALATFFTLVVGARGDVRSETESALNLAELAVRAEGKPPGSISDNVQALSVRHVSIRLLRHDGTLENMTVPAPDEEGAPPSWFLRLLDAGPLERRIDTERGVFVLTAEPADEVAEVWSDAGRLVTTATAGLAALLLLLTAVVIRSLRPLSSFAGALRRLERGELDVAPDAGGVPELADIGRRISALAGSLESARQENAALSAALVAAQDRERGELAREIHDELGPLLFGVSVDTHAISRAAADGRLTPDDLAGHAEAINLAVTQMRDVSRRLLRRLRPMALDHVPLNEVLSELLADLRRRHGDVDISLDCAVDVDRLGERIGLTVYRVVQEAAINALRHGSPSRLAILVSASSGGLTISVTDDGSGLDLAATGYGITTMRERVHALSGVFAVSPGPGNAGTRVSAVIPLPSPAQSIRNPAH